MIATVTDLWESATPVSSTIGEPYLLSKGVSPAALNVAFSMRCHPAGAIHDSVMPCVLFGFGARGRVTGIERHFIDIDSGACVLRDFVGSPAGWWIFDNIWDDEIKSHPMTLCIAQGIERAVQIGSSTGTTCVAVQDMSMASKIPVPRGIFELCIDDISMADDQFEDLRCRFTSMAFLVSAISQHVLFRAVSANPPKPVVNQ